MILFPRLRCFVPIGTIIIGLVLFLSACGDDETKPGEPYSYYLLLRSSLGLVAIDPEKTDTYQVVGDANSAQLPLLSIPDPAAFSSQPSHVVPSYIYAVYVENNHIYGLNLAKPAGLKPVQLSNEAEADTICNFGYRKGPSGQISHFEIRYSLPGPDGECYSTVAVGDVVSIDARPDNIEKYIDVTMGSHSAPRLTSKYQSQYPTLFTQSNFDYSDSIRFFEMTTTIEQGQYGKKQIGRLAIENNSLVWYRGPLELQQVQLLAAANQLRINSTTGNLRYYFIDVDSTMYLFDAMRGFLSPPIITVADRTDSYRSRVVGIPFGSGRTGEFPYENYQYILIDGSNLFDLFPQNETFVAAKMNPVGDIYERLTIFDFTETHLTLVDYTNAGPIYYSVPRTGGPRAFFVPLGYTEIARIWLPNPGSYSRRSAFYSTSENAVMIVDAFGRPLVNLPATKAQYSDLQSMLVTSQYDEATMGLRIRVLDLDYLRYTLDLGIVNEPTYPSDSVEVVALGKQYYGLLLNDELYIANTTNPGILQPLLPDVTNKSLR